ncbi:hypothetical protein [Edaphobacter flagellatus]|uniref:hypothetical protein n=1 Tax=Edaphobacter flagellatus TaxID=1933044 RepID=UPI0021B31137|nr:hypothetical protein [Edaphobacter flagellatus]
MTQFTSPKKVLHLLVLSAACAVPALLAGCGSGILSDGGATTLDLQGSVQGGLQPVSGATIQIYAASTGGAGTSAVKMSTSKISTNSKGSFALPSNFKCNNANDQIYVVATGGNPGGGTNNSLALMTDLGTCSNLKASTKVYINEITTIASVYALSKYMQPGSFDVASSSSDAPAVAAAYATAGTIANLGTGNAITTAQVYTKLNSLANSVATCVNSTSSSAACKALFAAATVSGSAPTNTISAILNIANNPTNNVKTIYNLASPLPFQPTLSSSPADWKLFGVTNITASAPVALVITWAAPSSITYGTALSGAQLNASTTVAGTFTYSPAAGTVLNAGTQALSVTFIPNDTTRYTPQTATVNLTVNKAAPALTWTTPSAITAGTALSAAQLNATANIPGTFAYSPAAGAVLQAGTSTLSASFTPADGTNYTTASKTVSLRVQTGEKKAPAITWATPAPVNYGTALSSAQLNATSSVPGTFAYSPAVGTVLQAGANTLSVTFTPNDTTTYSSSTATVSLQVNKATPVVTWATPAAITYGTALSSTQLNATANVAGSFDYTPAAGTTLSAGTQALSVTFTPTDTTDYVATTQSVNLTVNGAASSITWATPAAITYGTALSSTQLNATATVPGTFAYSPAAGTIPGAGTQALSVTFTPNDSSILPQTATVNLVVNQATPSITWAAPGAIAYGTTLTSAQLNATANVPGTFVYTPASGSVLTTGTTTLSALFTPTDAVNYTSATKTVSLTVNDGSASITWPNPAAITYGTALTATQLNATSSVPGSFVYSPAIGTVLTAGTQTLTATFTPNDTTSYSTQTVSTSLVVNKATPTITWAAPAAITAGTALSSTQLNATANVPGTFTYSPAAGTTPPAGTNTLSATFTPTDTTNYSTQTATVNLVVNSPSVPPISTPPTTPTITWATPAAITYGTALSSAQLNATASVPGTFAYSPASGTALSVGTQALKVTFTPNDTTSYTTATATVSLVVNKATPTITWAAPAAITAGTALSSTQLNATANVPGTFTYSPAAGTTPSAGTNTLSATFTPNDTTDYNTATASVSLVVNSTTPTITWATPAAITYGTALSSTQLNATASVAGSFSYSPASGTVLTAGTQTLKVTFTPTNTAYAPQTATVSLVVNKATPTITWATPAAITAGTALSSTQLNATANVPGTLVYSPASGTVLTAGTQTLKATFTPNDTTDYNTTTASVSLVVNSTTPTITWATPAAITYGTALSSTQLNATASVAGSFSYSPASGTVLTAGTQTLKVTFTPTNTAYAPQTATVSLVVNKATPTITWANPLAIIAGTALSSTQLNATASVPGTFAYSPALGAVLTAATNTLTVTFTPTDSTDYNTATASVTLSITGGSSSGATNIAIGSSPSVTGVKRLGMNITSQAYYDSGQMLRNLVFRNPGFEAEQWQTIIHCVAVTATSCTDSNPWAQWPANFVKGASFEFIYGGALGQTGTITSSTAASSNTGITINFAALSPAPKVGDFVVIRMSIPGNAQAGWWTNVSGGATLTTESTDLSPNTVGQQALRITAAGSGQSANVASYFDTYNGRSFVQMNGKYTIAFRAKGVGGANQVAVTFQRVTANGTLVYFNQTIPLTSSWQDYSFTATANETGNAIGNAQLSFAINGSSILLDDVSLTPATVSASNPTPFRDEVVSALTALHPGVLRYWDPETPGSTIDNLIAPAFARLRAGSSEQSTEADDVALGLHEFLQLCQTVGAEPYFNMPAGTSPTEMQNLIEYLGGASSTPYGAKRTARGQAAPWTSVFPVIHLELGNEQWNDGVFHGAAINDPLAYGQRIAAVFGAAKSSSSYNAQSFDLVMGSWAGVPWYTGQEMSTGANYDSVSVAPYLFNNLSDTSSNEAIFGSMFAQPEMVDSVSSGYMYQQAQTAKSGSSKVVVYEVNLSTLSGTASQSTVNSVVGSVGSGLTTVEHMLLMLRDLGITTQSIWALGGYNNQFNNTATGGQESTPLFGSVIDIGGQTNLRRPNFLAEQLANSVILPTLLPTTLSGANPTWVQALSANDSIQLSGAHMIQSFAFSDGAHSRSVIVFNLSRTSAQPVTFSGSNIPTGTVTIGQLTSANITDNNETTGTVGITSSTVSSFQASTPYSLPPFSMTVFSWQQ